MTADEEPAIEKRIEARELPCLLQCAASETLSEEDGVRLCGEVAIAWAERDLARSLLAAQERRRQEEADDAAQERLECQRQEERARKAEERVAALSAGLRQALQTLHEATVRHDRIAKDTGTGSVIEGVQEIQLRLGALAR